MTIDTRIDSLEAQVRTLKRILLGVGLAFVATLVGCLESQGVSNVIRSKQIEVVNDQGEVLVWIGENDYGDGFIQTQSNTGGVLANITSTIDNEGLFQTQRGLAVTSQSHWH